MKKTGILITVFLFSICIFAQDLPVKGFDLPSWEFSFMDLKRSVDPMAWFSGSMEVKERMARLWELQATDLYESPAELKNARADLEDWLTVSMAAKYREWLLDRFFGMEAARLRNMAASAVEEANRQYLFITDENGKLVFDEAGDPCFIRPDAGQDLEADRLLWHQVIDAGIYDALAAYNAKLAVTRPELISLLPDEKRETFIEEIDLALVKIEAKAVNEIKAMLESEERFFIARRTSDIWSLRRKSENQAAKELARVLADETNRSCEDSIKALETRIENSRLAGTDLALAGEDWLLEFQAQFDRGLELWKNTEEKFLCRRMEWELDASRVWEEGNLAWAEAFDLLEEARSNWEKNSMTLFQAGEAAFMDASIKLEEEISNAKSEYAKIINERKASASERLKAGIDTFLINAGSMNTAKDNIVFWMERIEDSSRNHLGLSTIEANDYFEIARRIERVLGFENTYKSTKHEMEEITALIEEHCSGNLLRSFYFLNEIDFMTEEAVIDAGYMWLENIENKIDALALLWEGTHNVFGTMGSQLENLLDSKSNSMSSHRYFRNIAMSCLKEAIGNTELLVESYLNADKGVFTGLDPELDFRISKAINLILSNIQKHGNEKSADLDAVIAARIEEAKLSADSAMSNWQSLIHSDLFKIKDNEEHLKEIKRWIGMHSKFRQNYLDSRQKLFTEYADVLGEKELSDFFSENSASEDFYLDEYQAELLKAKAVMTYWEKRLSIAEEVMNYALDLSAGRASEAESATALEKASDNYKLALEQYKDAVAILNFASDEIRSIRQAIEEAALVMDKASSELEKINREFSTALTVLALDNPFFIKEELMGLYSRLLLSHRIGENFNGSTEAELLGNYISRAIQYGFADLLGDASDALFILVTGKGTSPALASLKNKYDAIWEPGSGIEMPLSADLFGIEDENDRHVLNLLCQRLIMIEKDICDETEQREEKHKVKRAIEEFVKGARKRAELELQSRIDAIKLVSASTLEEWETEIGGQASRETCFSAYINSLIAAIKIQRDAALISFFQSLDSDDPLRDSFDLDSCEQNAIYLSYYTQCYGEDIELWLNAFDEILSAFENINSMTELEGEISALKETSLLLDNYFNGMNPFISGGIDMARIFTFICFEDSIQAESHLALLEEWGGLVRATEDQRYENSLDAIKFAFSHLGIQIDIDDFCMPSIEKLFQVLGDNGNDVWNNTMAILNGLSVAMGSLPGWLSQELGSWMDALTAYSSSRMLMDGKIPDWDLNTLNLKLDDLIHEYHYAITTDPGSISEIESEIIECQNKIMMMNKYNEISQKKIRDYEEGLLHWREYLNLNCFVEESSIPKLVYRLFAKDEDGLDAANSWSSGEMLDSSIVADRFAMGLNNAFQNWKLELDKITNTESDSFLADGWQAFVMLCKKYIDDPLEIYNPLEIGNTDIFYNDEFHFAQMRWLQPLMLRKDLQNNFAIQAKSWLSNSDITKTKALIAELEVKKEIAELVYENTLMEYTGLASQFKMAGEHYDNVFLEATECFHRMEKTRKELEAKEAVWRWASNAYLYPDEPMEEYTSSLEKMSRAQIAFEALHSLREEPALPYENIEYNTAFYEYKDAYNDYILVAKIKKAIEDSGANEMLVLEKALWDFNNIVNGYSSGVQAFSSSMDYENYTAIGEAEFIKANWNDFICIDNEGRLLLNRDEYELQPITDADGKRLAEYFDLSDLNRPGEYQNAIAELCKRLEKMNINFETTKKLALARDWLIYSLINDPGFQSRFADNSNLLSASPVLANHLYNTAGGSQYGFLRSKKLSSHMDDFRKEEIVYFGYFEDEEIRIPGQLYTYRKNAWDSLSDSQRADLEFLLVLSLTGANQVKAINDALTLASEYEEYCYVEGIVERWIRDKKKSWFGLGEVCGAHENLTILLNGTIKPQKKLIESYISNGALVLNDTCKEINRAWKQYQTSSAILELIGGNISTGCEISINDIINTANCLEEINSDEIYRLSDIWNRFSNENINGFYSLLPAMLDLENYTETVLSESKIKLENKHNEISENDSHKRLEYQRVYASFIDGETNNFELAAIIRTAFGNETSSQKEHILRLLELEMDLIPENENDATETVLNNFASLLLSAMNHRYISELEARQAEWNIERDDIYKKWTGWRETAGLILERGRIEFINGSESLYLGFNNWKSIFEDNYEQKSAAWEVARLELIEDKTNWIKHAHEAADAQSGKAIIALFGKDAEAYCRKADTNIIAILDSENYAASSFEIIMNNIGIQKLEKSLGFSAGSASSIAQMVKTGSKGPAAWDSAMIMLAVKNYTDETNRELAAGQARILAANTRDAALDAVNGLQDSVNRANRSFSDSMDDTFIKSGKWNRTGDMYVKEVPVHSTVFENFITEKAKVKTYIPYELKPWALKTDISLNNLEKMDHLSVREIIKRIQDEVKAKSEEVFGSEMDRNNGGLSSGTQTDGLGPGEFGKWTGYAPILKDQPDLEDGMDAIFQNQGMGEIGRLMKNYIYWSIKEGKGWAEINKPVYEKGLWDDRGIKFTAPTIRGVLDLGVSVGAIFLSGGTSLASVILAAGINLSDDLVFGALDVSGGYKSFEEAGLDFGKKALNSALSIATSGAFKGMEGAIGLTGGLDESLRKATVSSLRSISSSIGSSAINALQISETGLTWSGSAFSAGLKGGLISSAGSFVSGLTAGILNSGLEGFVDDLYFDASTLSSFTGNLLGEGLKFTMGGEAVFNIFNLGFLGIQGLEGNEINTGLLELRLGKNGISFGIGSDGMDASIGTVISSLKGLEAWSVNTQLAFSKQEAASKYKSALRTVYSIGGAESFERRLFDNILKGDTKIIEDAQGDYCAKTVLDKSSGKSTIFLGKDALEDGSRFGLNLVLVHEAWRNGIDDGERNQKIETNNAVYSHIKAADALGRTYGYSSLSEYQLNEVIALHFSNLGDSSYLFNVFDSYDSSEDFWKLTKDGKLLNDGLARLVVEVQDESGKSVWKLVEGSENEKSVSAALVSYLGEERAMQILAKDPYNLHSYDDQTLKDVLKLNDEQLKELRNDPHAKEHLKFAVSTEEMKKLIGEAIMKDNGIVWDDQAGCSGKWLNEGNGIMISDYMDLGNAAIRMLPGGEYERYTFGVQIERYQDAFEVWKNGVKDDRYIDNSRLSFFKWNLDNGELTDNFVAGGSWNTVDNSYGQLTSAGESLGTDSRYTLPDGSVVQSGTLAGGNFSMRLSEITYEKWGGLDSFMITNGMTIAGESILPNGHGKNSPYGGRWFIHNTVYGTSDGCPVYKAYRSQEDFYSQMLDTLKDLGLYYGYNMNGYLYDYNFTDYSYRW